MATVNSGNPGQNLAQTKAVFTLGGRKLRVDLEANERGLTKCQWAEWNGTDKSEKLDARVSQAHSILQTAVDQLGEYFAGERKKFDVPQAPAGTDFQKQVWKATRQIPYGQTRSYWWVAVRMGNPYAMRAVGSALGANPIGIIMPCHRVLRADGGLGGFASGLEWKKLLLAHECEDFASES